jgi:hypothetical protein
LNEMESSKRRVMDADFYSIRYDAYEKDIAIVQFYYKKSTIIQLGTQITMSWIDYFSAVGGLLGLVLGMGIVSVVEILWLCLRIVAKKLELTNWIS